MNTVPFIPPVHFTVSQIRVASACPRIFYFDSACQRPATGKVPRITRIWERGGAEASAGGSLFHNSVEKFNRLAGTEGGVRELLAHCTSRDEIFRAVMGYLKHECLNQSLLQAKGADVIANLSHCVEVYMGELADIVYHAMTRNIGIVEITQQLFADMPKRVDATFHFSPQQAPVHVTGRLDYIFFDRRSASLRIVDYKLAPANNPNKDQFQISLYALMYHHQHGFPCDATVFYLHPQRKLVELSWSDIQRQRRGVYRLMASMAEWTKYAPGGSSGLLPPGDTTYCEVCRWRTRCEATLGPKHIGEFASLPPEGEPLLVEARLPQPTQEEIADEIQACAEEREEGCEVEVIPMWPETKAARHDDSGIAIAARQQLRVGTYVNSSREVEIPYQHLTTHCAVVGAAGSGKTWVAKTIVEEAVLCGVPVIAIDPQGDVVQFIEPAAEATIPAQWLARYREFHQRHETRIFTPGSSHAIRLSLNPIRMPRHEEIDTSMSVERRQEEYIGMIEAVAVNLVGLVSGGKRSLEQQHSFVKQVLLRRLEIASKRLFDLADISQSIADPESIGISEDKSLSFIKKSDRENLARQINAIAYGPLSKLFTGGMSLDIDRLRTPSVADKVPINVIYLNALTDLEKDAFLAALATEIYRWMCCTGGSANQPQLLFYLDEARDYLPAGNTKPAAKGPLTRLIMQARKFGVGCLICTQSPRSVDYNVFGNCSTKLIGRLETPQDSERVAEWFTTTGPKPTWIGQRSGAERGTFVGRWPDQPLEMAGRVWTSRPLFTQHHGAWTAEQVESIVEQDPTHQALRRQST